jgi:hypothetical protein
MKTLRFSLLSATLVAALAAAGCGGGGANTMQSYNPPTPPAPPPVGESFTNWSKTAVFALPEKGAPVIMDSLVFNFDGDDNLDAYADLLPAT